MKAFYRAGIFGSLISSLALSQVAVPSHPEKFTSRSLGNGGGVGVDVKPREPVKSVVRYVTHIILFDDRMWTSTEGKPLLGKLIAFEDLVAETPKGATAPVMPTVPDKPTVTRGGKVRLLVNKKPVEVALARLSPSDQDFVVQIEASLAKKTTAP